LCHEKRSEPTEDYWQRAYAWLNHIMKVLELVGKTEFVFILETNGILIGNDRKLARQLSKFKNLHVRFLKKEQTGKNLQNLQE